MIGAIAPNMDVPSFEKGFWKEWKDSCKVDIDSMQTDPRITLEKIVKKVKDLEYLKNTPVIKAIQKRNKWEITIEKDGKLVEIKAKALVDAEMDVENAIIAKAKLVPLYDQHIKGLVTYSPEFQKEPYTQSSKLYRTSGAAGYGKDSTIVHFLPLGSFITKEQDNLLVANPMADIKGFSEDEFHNIALWTNLGQLIGATAAYGPFFDTTPAKANVRMIQGEVILYKSFLYPLTDIDSADVAWNSVQRIISTQLLSFDFVNGKFKPDEQVKASDIKTILSEIHPRSRIWFIENPGDDLSIEKAISLLSFITGREKFDLEREISSMWKDRYKFSSAYDPQHLLTKKELAVLLDVHLKPFSIRVNMAGYFII